MGNSFFPSFLRDTVIRRSNCRRSNPEIKIMEDKSKVNTEVRYGKNLKT
jgi:hypothetical protein